MRTAIMAAAWLVLAVSPAQGTSIIDPWVEILRAPAEPASIFCMPSGGGRAFAQAVADGGWAIDATLEIRLWTDAPGWGEPIPNFPREDIWLQCSDFGLVPCPGTGGFIPDSDTDAEGRTAWTQPLAAGGACSPDSSGKLSIYVVGAFAGGQPDGLSIYANSADLNGDGIMNLTDIGLFVSDLTGMYSYRSDFNWDGTINLVDVGWLATALGSQCP
ncbi:MAG TPA: hypothetical protein PLQ13_06205 [Candidatus Krumholzibacteria bacterium]|nr:hypothetical protein [Candidatus Krumholzibacteria bacterium]